MSDLAALDLGLHPKQALALETTATEVLYGGAAGGGKSYLMRLAAIIWCSTIPGLQVYLFRRIREDLIKNHMEGPKGFRAFLAGWTVCGFVKIVEDEIRFWNGSRIYICHCKDEKDVYKYQGAEIHVLLIDELTHFTESMYRFLRNRVRMVGMALVSQYEGRFPRILCGANPGNIGHGWVKEAFVIHALPLSIRQMGESEGGMRRQFIPACLDDNPSMAVDDPGYEARLSGLGSEALVRAMRDGDWDVVEGAFFTELSRDKHVIAPFAIPEHWHRFRSMDWGSARPFSVGWWAVVSDDYALTQSAFVTDHRNDAPPSADNFPEERIVGAPPEFTQRTSKRKNSLRMLPRGAIVRYREWYGASAPNVGLKLTAEQVAQGIREREKSDPPGIQGVLDPAAFTADGGPSIAERLAVHGVLFRRADNARVARNGAMGGWDQLRARLIGDGERPMLYIFSTCQALIRTLPALQHDRDRPEDLDTEGEDHAADETRYACMSRPYIREAPANTKPKYLQNATLDDLWDVQERSSSRGRI